MHDGERLIAVLVKTYDAVDVVEGFTRRRDDERQLRRRDFLSERPIREVAARDFEVIVTVEAGLVAIAEGDGSAILGERPG